MSKNKGFLLLELIGALFLLTLGITLSMNNLGYIKNLADYSLQGYKRTCLVQNALEKARLAPYKSLNTQIIDGYTIETIIKNDSALKNFLHIEVTMYDKEKSFGTWFSGVAMPYEA